ncbi:MAG: hypothetical protein RL662_2324 [Bacteroidota bacterium]|jgi:hypothetical protein
MIRYIHLLLFILISKVGFAQVDSSYIGFYSQKISTKVFLGKKNITLEEKLEQDRVFRPNNPLDIGLGISINNTVISGSLGYGFDFLRDKKRGKTKYFDYQLHNYNRKHVLDIFYQRYSGFYIEETGSQTKLILAPDLRVSKYGILGEYAFNGNKFSYRAAFDQSEKQLRSAGSFLIGGGAQYSVIKSDSSFVHKENNKHKSIQFGIRAGYAYTWVATKNILISGSVAVGADFGNRSLYELRNSKLEVYPTTFTRFTASYNQENWSVRLAHLSSSTFTYFSDKQGINLNSGTFELSYIKRIDTPAFIAKFLE